MSPTLRPFENLEPKVEQSLLFLKKHNMWFLLSENPPSTSCSDAANNRVRLGNRGIPLPDEMKSSIEEYCDSDGVKQYAVFHCRAHQKLNYEEIKNLLKISEAPKKMSSDSLRELFQMEYGEVTPFRLHSENVTHIFDRSVLSRERPPFTMHTNAGVKDRGIEFYPSELISSLPNSLVADIVYEKKTYTTAKIGILTGNGPESGMHLWNLINYKLRTAYNSKKDSKGRSMNSWYTGDLSLPYVLIESDPGMGISMELEFRHEPTKDIVLKGVESLCKRGAKFVCLACNTTQFFEKDIMRICAKYGTEYISMVNAVEQYLDQLDVSQFAFLGIDCVTGMGTFSAFRKWNEKYSIEQISSTQLDYISDIAYSVKKEGVTQKSLQKLRSFIGKNVQSRTVLVALTELSIIFADQKGKKKSQNTYLDTLDILATEIVDRYLRVCIS